MKNILDKMASRGVEALSDRELLALLTDCLLYTSDAADE